MSETVNSTKTTSIPGAATRRQFLQTSAGSVAAAAVAGSLPWWFGTQRSVAANFVAANDRPRVGCIGTGSRWEAVGPNAMEFGDVLAVCDVDEAHTNKGKQIVKAKQQRDVDGYGDYRKILERSDIDVVTIVTPDHWHSKIAIEALRAGKDVYCEKPLTLTIDEGKQIIKALDETKRVFQVGTQQRSEMDLRFLQALAIIQDGRIGKITKVNCAIGGSSKSGPLKTEPVPASLNWDMWLGQAPKVEYIPRRCHYEFRWWYEYSGGKMTDWGAHHVDIAQWAIGMDKSGPTQVIPVSEVHPVPFKDGYPTIDNEYNAATDFEVKCLFPNGVEMTIRAGENKDNGIMFEGTEGRFFVSRGALRGKPVEDLKDKPLPEDWLKKAYKGKLPEKSNAHMANFFECLKSRELPISDVYTHHRSMTTCHLANIAIRLKKTIEWNPETEQIQGDKEAQSFQAREQRKGFEIS